MLNFYLLTGCGRILMRPIWMRRWKNSTEGNGGLAQSHPAPNPQHLGQAVRDDCSRYPSAESQIHSARADRGNQSLLASDQVLVVSAAGPSHARRIFTF